MLKFSSSCTILLIVSPLVAAAVLQVLSLQAEVAAVQEAAAGREAELRQQIDRLRQEKRELEGKLGGVDVKAMQVCAALLAIIIASIVLHVW